MYELWLPLGILVFWIVLNRWVLPWFGIPTCMSGGCAANRCVQPAPSPGTHRDENAAESR